MARLSVNFALKDDDWERYQELLVKFPTKVTTAVDEYMHGEVKQKMIKSITGEMPRSKEDKIHAKDTNWYVSFNFNQAVTVESKVAGSKKNSFYYLCFPHEGTIYQKSNPFMERAVDKEYNSIVNGLFKVIDEKIKEDL